MRRAARKTSLPTPLSLMRDGPDGAASATPADRAGGGASFVWWHETCRNAAGLDARLPRGAGPLSPRAPRRAPLRPNTLCSRLSALCFEPSTRPAGARVLFTHSAPVRDTGQGAYRTSAYFWSKSFADTPNQVLRVPCASRNPPVSSTAPPLSLPLSPSLPLSLPLSPSLSLSLAVSTLYVFFVMC